MRHIVFKMGSILICLLLLCGTAYAAEQEGKLCEGFFDGLDYDFLSRQSEVQLLGEEDETEKVKADILAALQNVQMEVDLQKYNLTCSEATALHMEVVHSHPELFYVNSSCGYMYVDDENVLPENRKAVSLNYSVSTAEKPGRTYAEYATNPTVLAEKKKAIEAERNHIIGSLYNEMSDVEKALAVHDWFALHYAYDTPASLHAFPTSAHRIDGLLLDEKAVCQGYMLGYKYILEMLDIDAVCMTSAVMGHGWNMVEIEDKWYHVDVTHDDATNRAGDDIFGRVLHRNFLCSEAGIRATGHAGWRSYEPIGTVSSENYEGFWCDIVDEDGEVESSVNGGVFYASGAWYYLRDNTIVSYKNGTETVLKNLQGAPYYWNGDGGYYGASAGCRIGLYDGRLYYNTPTEIRSMEMDGTGDRVEYKPLLEEDISIYGIRIGDGLLYYATAYDANEGRTVYEPLHMEVHFRAWKHDGQIEINMMDHPEAGSFLHVAAYKGDELIFLQPIPVTDALLYTVPAEDASDITYKVFLWHGIVPSTDVVQIDA